MSNLLWKAFEIFIDAFDAIVIIDFISKFLGFKFSGIQHRVGAVTAFLAIFFETMLINYLTVFENMAIFIPMIFVFTYSIICLNGKLVYKIFLSISIILLLALINSLVGFSVSAITGVGIHELMSKDNIYRLICILIMKILLFYTTRIILRYNNHNQNSLKKLEWFSVIVNPAISIIILGAITLVSIKSNPGRADQGYLMIAVSGVFVINIITYYLFVKIRKENKLEIELSLLHQQYSYQQQHSNEIKSIYDEIIRIRHDMNNHLFCISTLLHEMKYETAEEYCSRVIKQISNTKRMINTGNDVVDSIINAKLTVASRLMINVKCSITDKVSDIDDMDICILLGNLFDNAIEACNKLPIENRYIELNISKKKMYLSILIKNSIQKSVLTDNPNLSSEKVDTQRHGIGHISVRNVVEKNNGLLEYYEEQNLFCCSILLKQCQCLEDTGNVDQGARQIL